MRRRPRVNAMPRRFGPERHAGKNPRPRWKLAWARRPPSCRRVSKCCGSGGGRPSLRPPPRLRITPRIMAESQCELLLLVPTTSYRLDDFRAAALRLGVPLVVGSDRCHQIEDFFGEEKDLLSLDYRRPARAAEQIADAARTRPIRGIVPASDPTAVIAALAAERLGLPHNPPAAARRAANKLAMREALRDRK